MRRNRNRTDRYSYTFKNRSGSKIPTKQSRRIFFITLSVVLSLLIIVSYILLLSPIAIIEFNSRIRIESEFPGSASETMTRASSQTAVNLLEGMNILFADDMIASSCSLDATDVTKTLHITEDRVLEDQLDLLSFYAEHGSRSEYNSLLAAIKQNYLTGSGLYSDGLQTDIKLDLNMKLCRILLEGNAAFGKKVYLDEAIAIADILYPFCIVNGILPATVSLSIPSATPTPDYSATPTPKPTAVPTLDPSKTIIDEVIDLSEIDLYALKLLAQTDTKWNKIYESSLAILKGALISEPAAIFLAGYDTSKYGYIPYLGTSAVYGIDSMLSIALHLSEVGELAEQSYSYLSQTLINNRAFFKSYSLLTALPITDEVSLPAYAMMARIARINNDIVIYDFCISRLEMNIANSPTSKILGLTYTLDEDGNIYSKAHDSIYSLKAFY